MPLDLQHPIQRICEKEFHQLDYKIMEIIFAIHSDLGRFYDEEIYQTELSRRCEQSGISSTKEFEIRLIHKDFTKSLFIDLLINHSTVYELKANKHLSAPNRIQTLNYLFATDTHHAKLVNFRPKSVEHEFVSTQLNRDKRREITIIDDGWANEREAKMLRSHITNLLNDWGAFFDTDIYLAALYHLLGGKDKVLQDIEIRSDNVRLGTQKLPLLTNHAAFCLTSVNKNMSAYREHLVRFLSHTQLNFLHWINLNRSTLNFSSLKRESFCP